MLGAAQPIDQKSDPEIPLGEGNAGDSATGRRADRWKNEIRYEIRTIKEEPSLAACVGTVRVRQNHQVASPGFCQAATLSSLSAQRLLNTNCSVQWDLVSACRCCTKNGVFSDRVQRWLRRYSTGSQMWDGHCPNPEVAQRSTTPREAMNTAETLDGQTANDRRAHCTSF